MGRFLAFLLGIAGALVGSQGPGFTLQYMQNLQGRVDELTSIVEDFDTQVASRGSLALLRLSSSNQRGRPGLGALGSIDMTSR